MDDGSVETRALQAESVLWTKLKTANYDRSALHGNAALCLKIMTRVVYLRSHSASPQYIRSFSDISSSSSYNDE